MDMKATIGIITHNRAAIISECLSSVGRQTVKPEKIVIVDDSDNNETEKIVKKSRLPVKYIHVKERIRQPPARNLIIKNTKTDIIAFLDDDAVPKREWLENILAGYKGKDVAAVTGPAVNCTLNLKPLAKYKYTDRTQNTVNSAGDVRFNGAWIPSRPAECKVMIGANMSFRMDMLKAAGGFIDFYKEGYGFREENFPQMVLLKRGYKFIYMPRAFVWHIKTRTGGADKNVEHFYLCGKYHRYFADKFFPKWKSRLSWIFWSVSPPCIWLCVLLAVARRDRSILKWHKGLWGF